MSDYEWVFFPAAVLAVLLFRIALAPFWMQREVKQNLTTPNTEDLRALVATVMTVLDATDYGAHCTVDELRQQLEAALAAPDPAVAADDVPTVTIMEDVGDPEWFTQPSQCAVKVGLAAELDELKAVAPPPERTAGLELATLSIMFARHGFNPVVGGEYEALIREISALTQPASQPGFATTCTGHQHEDCNYLGFCGSVCNKCGNLLECVTWKGQS